jgi:CRP/FNR family cyclic AMP-dependent transcriptional regulator
MISPELLRRYPLFADQSPYTLEEISMISSEIEVDEGQWLFYEKGDASKFYIVVDGAISLTMYLYLNGDAQHIATMEPIGKGEILGWSALVKPYRYTLGARAAKKSRLIEIEAEPLRELLDDNPEYGYYLIKQVAEVIGERLVFKCVQLLSMVVDSQGKSVKQDAKR